jgi:hypothetical protein
MDCKLVKRQIGFAFVVKVMVGSHEEGLDLSRDRASFRDLMELLARVFQL